MHNEKIHLTRIKRLLERLEGDLYPERVPLEASYAAQDQDYTPVKPGEVWGKAWSRAVFRVQGSIPESMAGKQYGLFFDCDGEACLMLDGSPYQGFTPKTDWYHKSGKHFCSLVSLYAPGESIDLVIEASANDLFGVRKELYALRCCDLAVHDEELFQRVMDLGVLLNLAENLPAGTVRRQRLIYGLNRVCDLWQSDPAGARDMLRELLAHPAHSSALTAFSVGHAHLDLAWLWPVSESKRKGGRTFANALRLLEQYPDYQFGASQAQLYQWMKDLYPELYQQVKQRVAAGRWEVQGASWVEFDTNLISGESIIRQFMYGRRFFREEFGLEPDILWLPDCFGFSGNLPQYMKGCGVHYFVTQKLSWNESNVFPHHLLFWEGIDGSRILAHQLPTNDYNFSNDPQAFLETEKRYAQSEMCDSFLNLYGIGDGGGGPTRNHIEYGLRQQDLEGVCKFRFASAAEFFRHLGRQDLTGLPVAYGELYLEFHRGTYTTQAHTKTDNSRSEFNLGAAEFWAVLCRVKPYPEFLRELWRDTLLLQFHDILPGSSIHQVYQDAFISSAYICIGWQGFMSNLAQEAADQDLPKGCRACLILNACNRELVDWLEFPKVFLVKYLPQDEQGDTLPFLPAGDYALEVKVRVPAFSCRQIIFVPAATKPTPKTKRIKSVLENKCLRVRLTPTGGIASILDKRTGRELLAADSNLLQLWEDEPNNWGAWDINHFYRTTQPQGVGAAKLVAEKSIRLEGEFDRVVMNLEIGNSKLTQTVELRHGEPFIRFQHSVTWKEEHRMLRVHFRPDLHSAIATYGIQGGVIQRSTKPKNAWEEAQFEVPAQRFADLSQPDRGCALISGTKYGYRVRDNQMELNLLRSPADVDPEADLGYQSYAYAFYPHTGDYAKSDVFQVAEQFVNKLIRIDTKRLFTQVPEPFFSFTCDHVNLDTVKPAEEGAGIVLRFHEYKGQSGTAKLKLKRPFKQVWLCNMLEEVITPLKPDATFSLDFRPFEIKTLLLLEES